MCLWVAPLAPPPPEGGAFVTLPHKHGLKGMKSVISCDNVEGERR